MVDEQGKLAIRNNAKIKKKIDEDLKRKRTRWAITLDNLYLPFV